MTPYDAKSQADLVAYEDHWESPELAIEDLLVSQVPVAVLRRFLDDAVKRDDFPVHQPTYDVTNTDAELPAIASKVLKARKGDAWGYAALLIEQCQDRRELPPFLVDALDRINELVAPPVLPEEMTQAAGDAEGMEGDPVDDPEMS